MIYLVQPKDSRDFEVVCAAVDEGDACIKAEEIWQSYPAVDNMVDEAGGLEEYKLQIIQEYTVTPIDRALCLQYVEWCLDGNHKISIVL